MNPFAPLLRSLRRRLRTEERGFTLVELMVAQGIILVSLLSLAYTATVGFKDTAFARQRDGANGVANQILEQVRSLPFDTIKRGLDNADLGGDASIVQNVCPGAGTYCYRPIPSAPYEAIPHGNNGAAVVPLNPHKTTVTVGPTTYSRSVYITYYAPDPSLNTFRITVVVDWASSRPARLGVAARVQAETIAYSPNGCTNTATHPFAAPCQPFLYANASIPAGTINLVPTLNSVTGGVAGLDLDTATIYTMALNAAAQNEQVASITGQASTSGADFDRTSTTIVRSGQQVISSTAENDPAQPGHDHDPSGSFPATLTGSGTNTFAMTDDDDFRIIAGTGDTLTSGSTIAASATHPCGTQLDLLPCAKTSGVFNATHTAQLEINQDPVDLEPAPLAVMSPSAGANTALAHFDATSGLDGSMGAQVTRVFPTVQLGGLPTDFAPSIAGWTTANKLIRLSGYTATLEAQAGRTISAMPLTASVTGGVSACGFADTVIQYWNGTNGYNCIRASQLNTATPVSFTVSFDRTVTLDGQPVRIQMSGTFTAGGVTITQNTGATSTNRTSAIATALPALAGTLTYKVLVGPSGANQVQADLTINVNLGTVTASANYTPAPGGG